MKKLYFILAFGIIFSLILNPGCKKGEDSTGIDIRGLWNTFNGNCPSCHYMSTWFGTLNFTGSATGGNVVWTLLPGTVAEDTLAGTWSVSGSSVTFTFTSYGNWQFSGNIASATSMSGTANLDALTATWNATK